MTKASTKKNGPASPKKHGGQTQLERICKKKKDSYCFHRNYLIYMKNLMPYILNTDRKYAQFRLNGNDLRRPKTLRNGKKSGGDERPYVKDWGTLSKEQYAAKYGWSTELARGGERLPKQPGELLFEENKLKHAKGIGLEGSVENEEHVGGEGEKISGNRTPNHPELEEWVENQINQVHSGSGLEDAVQLPLPADEGASSIIELAERMFGDPLTDGKNDVEGANNIPDTTIPYPLTINDAVKPEVFQSDSNQAQAQKQVHHQSNQGHCDIMLQGLARTPSAEGTDLTEALSAALDAFRLETPYSYLSDRLHPCLPLNTTLCRLRKAVLGIDYEFKRDKDTNRKLVKALIEQETKCKSANRLSQFFQHTLQFPYIVISEGRGIREELRGKYGHSHVDGLYESLKENQYNQSVMKRFRREQGRLSSENELKWNLVPSGMVFITPSAKPVPRRYLNFTSSQNIHSLFCFGHCLDKLKSIKVNGRNVMVHTRMSDHEAYFGENRCLDISEHTAFITPDCLTICSNYKIDEDTVKTVVKRGCDSRIEEFKHIESGQEWDSVVIGYHLYNVTEVCIDRADAPIKIGIEPWEVSDYVLGIPNHPKFPSGIPLRDVTLRSRWYKSNRQPMYESEKTRELEVLEFGTT